MVDNNIIIGQAQPCKHCGKSVRVVYIYVRDTSKLIEDTENVATGRLIEHACPNYHYRFSGGPR
jgi:hypothetical protein